MPDSEILNIRQLAEYLMVSEKTVYRMLDRNQLPALRVGTQWRFRRQDIDAWLEQQVQRPASAGNPETLDTFASSELSIHPLLSEQNVWLSIEADSRDALLERMLREGDLDPDVDRDQLLRSILDREAICSTALVEQAAFPHPVDPRPFHFSRKRVLIATLREPLEFNDPHGHQPSVIAMILARRIQGHMLAFSRALKIFADPVLIDALLSVGTPADAIEAIRIAEEPLDAMNEGVPGEEKGMSPKEPGS
ncbi:MAG: helix-turn-helix domain-containing protein [Thermoanaerobaculia bacterium]